MSVSDNYSKLPFDLAGASSKNRFRLEMLWGASKMFDLFDEDDFCVVFDYKCDIEVHLNDSLEFYQIKTHKVQSPYTFATLSKQDKTGKSIIGKLFLLKNTLDPTAKFKVAIVSNAYLKIEKKVYSDVEYLDFSCLNVKTQQAVRKALNNELGPDIDLNNIGFIYTSMNLLDPDNDLRGKIVGSFEKIMGCEPDKPNALYRLVKDSVEIKACYEMVSNSYEELVKNKGITKQELYDMLCRHATIADNSISNVEKFIEDNINAPSMLKKYKSSLVSIVKYGPISAELKSNEKLIVSYLNENDELLPDNRLDTVNMLYSVFSSNFSVEFSEIDIRVFILLILFKWEGGKYE
ncbi:MAG: DUF4297 domain-containing protein [Oscillospiraceae bacterium]|nr:DUF4297 domain-containing protein [Oscillospiraceae bacterium]